METTIIEQQQTMRERRANAIRRLAVLAEEPIPDESQSSEVREVLVLEMLAKMLETIDYNFQALGFVDSDDNGSEVEVKS
jgi:hypothetical protein